jgi:regulator of protease activity HflC (stomatin/prohibitin superfamily)
MKSFLAGVLGFIGVVLLIVFVRSMRIIDVSQSCAWVRFGNVVGAAKPGFQFVNPLNSKVCYPQQAVLFQTAADVDGDGKVESTADYYNFPVEVKTSDGQSANVEFNLTWHVQPECAVQLREDVASNVDLLVTRVVDNFSRSIPRDLAPKYSAKELYGTGRTVYENDIKETLIPMFVKACVVLDEFILRDINFDPAYEDTMEQKQIQNARGTVTNAKAAADAAIETARGQAKTVELMAIAEAEAMRVKGQALRDFPEMLKLKFFDALTTANWSLVPWSAIQGYLPITP